MFCFDVIMPSIHIAVYPSPRTAEELHERYEVFLLNLSTEVPDTKANYAYAWSVHEEPNP